MFPHDFDNTTREAIAICLAKARYAHLEHLAPPAPSVHPHFGSAVAAGLEAARRSYYEKGFAPQDAIEAGCAAASAFFGDFDPPANSYKTKHSVEQAIRYYFQAWPFGECGLEPIVADPLLGIAAEWKFRIPIPGLVHPDDGGPLFAVGRSDLLGRYHRTNVVEDDKTTSALGPSWTKQWDLDSQFTQYAWAAQQLLPELFPPGDTVHVLIRGISVLSPKFRNATGKLLKTAPSTSELAAGEAVYDLDSSFGNALAYTCRPQWVIERWFEQFRADIARFIHAYLNDEWTYALHKGACQAYGGCAFRDLCMSQHPESWKEVNFVRRVWNPLEAV